VTNKERTPLPSEPTNRAGELFSLKGRTAVVTGSGRNIGKAIALLLASAGANIVVNGRKPAPLADVVKEIEDSGGRATAIAADVSKPDDVRRLVQDTCETFGSVDIMISNVGLRKHKPFLELSTADWNATLDANLNSAFHLAQAALPLMMKKGWGRFIVMSGLDGFNPLDPERAQIVVSKLGLCGLAKAVAREFGPYGITANAIVPGLMATDRDWSHFPNFDKDAFEKSLPLQRMGTADDVAAMTLYLCSDAAAFITGQAMHINGGQQMF
jgi:3-oxoacyl-[acyl-carrier protein] reductase